ncbi:PREDICTED: uncharacterized protein LOC106811479, partial [Priapulus caudatus]|uniref:Uncharacterized protein LOC106811479 n=1 Tax=Priapulus caudatus TaxID=37621 RepID=A0ABM1EEI1_PRICU
MAPPRGPLFLFIEPLVRDILTGNVAGGCQSIKKSIELCRNNVLGARTRLYLQVHNMLYDDVKAANIQTSIKKLPLAHHRDFRSKVKSCFLYNTIERICIREKWAKQVLCAHGTSTQEPFPSSSVLKRALERKFCELLRMAELVRPRCAQNKLLALVDDALQYSKDNVKNHNEQEDVDTDEDTREDHSTTSYPCRQGGDGSEDRWCAANHPGDTHAEVPTGTDLQELQGGGGTGHKGGHDQAEENLIPPTPRKVFKKAAAFRSIMFQARKRSHKSTQKKSPIIFTNCAVQQDQLPLIEPVSSPTSFKRACLRRRCAQPRPRSSEIHSVELEVHEFSPSGDMQIFGRTRG